MLTLRCCLYCSGGDGAGAAGGPDGADPTQGAARQRLQGPDGAQVSHSAQSGVYTPKWIGGQGRIPGGGGGGSSSSERGGGSS